MFEGEKIDYKKLKNKKRNIDVDLLFLKEQFKKRKYHSWIVDLTIPSIQDLGISVVKVLIPELYPMYNNQKFPYKQNKRLYDLPVEMGFRDTKIKENEILWHHPL